MSGSIWGRQHDIGWASEWERMQNDVGAPHDYMDIQIAEPVVKAENRHMEAGRSFRRRGVKLSEAKREYAEKGDRAIRWMADGWKAQDRAMKREQKKPVAQSDPFEDELKAILFNDDSQDCSCRTET